MPVMIKNKYIKLVLEKFVEIAELIRLGKLPSLEKLKEENQRQEGEVQDRQQQRQQKKQAEIVAEEEEDDGNTEADDDDDNDDEDEILDDIIKKE
jgi:hypothetical protein